MPSDLLLDHSAPRKVGRRVKYTRQNKSKISEPEVGSAYKDPPKRRPIKWFVPIPAALMCDPAVSSNAKVVASILLHYEGSKGCFPKQDTLSKHLGCSIDTIQRCLNELHRYGFLEIQQYAIGRRNAYTLKPEYTAPERLNSLSGDGLGEESDPSVMRRPLPRRALVKRFKPGQKYTAPVRYIAGGTSTVDQTTAGEESTASMRPIDRTDPDAALVRPIQTALMRSDVIDTPHQSGTRVNNQSYQQKNSNNAAAFFKTETEEFPAENSIDDLEKALGNIVGISALVASSISRDLHGIERSDLIVNAVRRMIVRPKWRAGQIKNVSGYVRALLHTNDASQPVLLQTMPASPRIGQHVDDARAESTFESDFASLSDTDKAIIYQIAQTICAPTSPAYRTAIRLAFGRFQSTRAK